MNINAQAEKKAARVITASAFISMFVFSLSVSLPNSIINEVVNAFSLAGTSEGLMGSLIGFGSILSLFVIPMLQGRAQKTTVLAAGCAAQAVMLLACGSSSTFPPFCAACVALGFGSGFLDIYSNSSIVDVQRAAGTNYLGYLHGLCGVGNLLTPLLVYGLLQYTDWRGIQYAIAAVSALAALAVGLLAGGGGKKNVAAAVREKTINKKDMLDYIHRRRNILLAFAGAFFCAAQTGVMVWVVRYMAVRFDAAELGALSLSAFWLCVTFNRFCLSRLVSRAPMMIFSLGAVLCGALISVGVFSDSPVVMCVMVGAAGLACGSAMPVVISESAVGYEGRTTFTTSFMIFVLGIARVIIPLVIAFVSTHISFVYGMLVPAAAAFTAAAFGWMAINTERKSAI